MSKDPTVKELMQAPALMVEYQNAGKEKDPQTTEALEEMGLIERVRKTKQRKLTSKGIKACLNISLAIEGGE